MNAKQFLTLLNKGNSFQKEDFTALLRLHETFPYFAIPVILAAKFEMDQTGGESSELLHWASVQSPDRAYLKRLIEHEIGFLAPPAPGAELTESMDELSGVKEEDAPAAEVDDFTHSYDNRAEILKKLEENLKRFKMSSKKPSPGDPDNTLGDNQPKDEDLIKAIKKKKGKAIPDQRQKDQIDLIKAFSKKTNRLAVIRENENTEEIIDLSKESTDFNDHLVTESFAKLLVKQGKKDKALEIYQKLILKFPDKTAYFVALIKELED